MGKKSKFDKMVIGIVGGMGSYATLDIFREFLKATPAEKEWDRPRIIIDNRCTMPSRGRAVIFEDERRLLVKQLSDSIRHLLDCDATHIIMGAVIAYAFLDEILTQVPEAEDRIVNIVDILAKKMQRSGVKSATFIATEGTVMSGVLESTCARRDIALSAPLADDYIELSYLREAVKQDIVDDEICARFADIVRKQAKFGGTKEIILGSTEFPCIYKQCKELFQDDGFRFWDPIQETIARLKD